MCPLARCFTINASDLFTMGYKWVPASVEVFVGFFFGEGAFKVPGAAQGCVCTSQGDYRIVIGPMTRGTIVKSIDASLLQVQGICTL